MTQRLADAGYVVLLPDLFYRYGSYGPFVPEEVFKGDVRAILGPLKATTGNDKAAAEDTEAFLSCIDKRGDVDGQKVVSGCAWLDKARLPGLQPRRSRAGLERHVRTLRRNPSPN